MVSANGEIDLYNQLQEAGYELLDCKKVGEKNKVSFSLGPQKVTLRDLIQFFVSLEQMQGAGIPVLECISDIRDSADNNYLRDVLTEIHRDIYDGGSVSESFAKHPKIFSKLHISLIAAGEETGDLPAVYRQLIRYMKWTDDMQTMVRKATKQPMIILFVVIITIVIMMGVVVPQIVEFIATAGLELPWYTVALIATSKFFQNFWWLALGGPVAVFFCVKLMRQMSREFAQKLDELTLVLPTFGEIVRKVNIARYCQTFGALYASGISVTEALKSASETVKNLALLEALDSVEEYVQAGSSLSEAFDASGEFPSMVVRMLRIGEESGKLNEVLDQVSDFYTKEVDESVQGLIAMIEPTLTGILGGLILWIAAGVFGPIYSSFENLDF